MRAATYPDVCRALAAQWTVLVNAFAQADPVRPSRLPGWTVADLERHLAQTAQSLGRLADGPAAEGEVSGLAQWATSVVGLSNRFADQDRAATAPLAEAAAAAFAALPDANPNKPVRQLTGTHRLADAALFRLVETVVHALDLPEPPASDRQAERIVVRALADLLVKQAPGRSVELRIPPFAAVQLVPGPRHTRGTPSGVVETDPATFLRLVSGRTIWAEAAAAGRLRASGERTDLSGYLPLLR